LTDEDWARLQELAELNRADDFRPTPGQIASVLLHQTLETLEQQTS
jgi:hypothetical protein